MPEVKAHTAKSAPTATTTITASKAHLDDEVGSIANSGKAGMAPKLWVNGETKVSAPTAKPVPVKYESTAMAALGK